ncbi:MAG TPA: hypothetical protein VN033_06780 [Vulgatibacter sp.]|nr:hypothetical protein [Vulgatibacter sp.]
MTRSRRRPNLGIAIKAIMRDAARRIPDLSAVDPSRILIVAGEARRASRATVRPLRFACSGDRISADGKRAKPVVQIRGRRMLYVVTFRPRFFLRSSPEKRVETILHELWHISPTFDGTLYHDRRHASLPGSLFRDQFRPVVECYLAQMPASLLEGLSHDGEVIMRQWIERPAPFFPIDESGTNRSGRRPVFTEAQLFYGPVKMITSGGPGGRR